MVSLKVCRKGSPLPANPSSQRKPASAPRLYFNLPFPPPKGSAKVCWFALPLRGHRAGRSSSRRRRKPGGETPLHQLGLLFRGEQAGARAGGKPRRRTTFEAPREGAEEGSGRRVHWWPRGAGGGERLFQQRDAQPVQRPPPPPPPPGLACGAKARSRLSCTCRLCLA